MTLTPGMLADDRLRVEMRGLVREETDKALSVAVMGQTGVGKSSLLNALFGAELTVGDVSPTTKFPEPVSVTGLGGYELTFWDLPGIGESAEADEEYLELYRTKLLESDVVLWGLHADSRSTTFDRTSLDRLISGDAEVAGVLMSKVTFVLTKADSLHPTPWVFVLDGKDGTFVPTEGVEILLTEKESFFEGQLLSPFGSRLISRTYLEPGFVPRDSRLECDGHHVTFHGHVDDSVYRQLLDSHAGHQELIERLRDNHRVVTCSSRYRYNLLRLLSVVVNKIGVLATKRFERLVCVDGLERLTAESARGFGGFVIWDARRRRKVFDLQDLRI